MYGKITHYGLFTIMNFGFSKQEKITAARALIDHLKNGTPIPESCKPALYQGELGKIAAPGGLTTEVQPPNQSRPFI